MDLNGFWVAVPAEGPLLATAIHAGHDLHPLALAGMALPEADRLREEDPFTDQLAALVPCHVKVSLSRFCVDLNRPPETAVYETPEQAWGLQVWRDRPSADLVAAMGRLHGDFYEMLDSLIQEKIHRHGRCLVLDLHSYNHRRGGPDAQPDPEHENPEINVGTGYVEQGTWG